MSIPAHLNGAGVRFDERARAYDALLVLSFGGPEGPDDVIPFLENVTKGRTVPRKRLLAVAEHYQHFGGVSPINDQNRMLVTALAAELEQHQIELPIYFGNRNWHPFVEATVQQMREDGIRRALVFVTSAFSSYSGCRQYREDLARAVEPLGADELELAKLRVFYNHPGFVRAMAERVEEGLGWLAADRRAGAALVFTAHSIPLAMARSCAYEAQLRESCRLVTESVGIRDYRLAYQSRSGSPQVPWLEPDILDELERVRDSGGQDVLVTPIGFVSDHMEVMFDLDEEAMARSAELGLTMVRVGTAGTHPAFVTMIRELIEERMTEHPTRLALGSRGPSHDICPINCCPRGEGRPAAGRVAAGAVTPGH
ncbi:MAG: ferrochelatase [Chloroflexota bacterium]|nr:ferrochelatase [Chloroflexota bacterium]